MFSVVIPLYNKELSISNTIQSVLNQTFQDFEIVVVNDGSTDNSLQVVEQINDSRIRIITKPNGGVSSARNRGIKEAKYDWIAFLDGDDAWDQEYLSEINNLITNYPEARIFSTNYARINNRNEILNIRTSSVNKGYITDYFSANNYQSIVCSSAIVFKKSCITDGIHFNENLSFGEDLDFWIKLLKNNILAYSPKILSFYRVDSENRSSVHIHKPKNNLAYYLDFSKLNKNSSEFIFKKKILVAAYIYYIQYRDFRSLFELLKKHNFKYITNLLSILLHI